MITIRPHHVLCINGFVGKGYDKAFVANMQNIVKGIMDDGMKMKIVFSTDDICSKCPYKQDENSCRSQKKVENFDMRTVEILGLYEKHYTYADIREMIKRYLTAEKLEYICKECSWLESGICKEKMNLS
jgi:hypothetical protein